MCKIQPKLDKLANHKLIFWTYKKAKNTQSQDSSRYYTLKSRRLDLSNLWASECPCGTQEILKVEDKL